MYVGGDIAQARRSRITLAARSDPGAAGSHIVIDGERLANLLANRPETKSGSSASIEISVRDIDVVYRFSQADPIAFCSVRYEQVPSAGQTSRRLTLGGIGQPGIGGLIASAGADGTWTLEAVNWRLDDPEITRLLNRLRGGDWWQDVLSGPPSGRFDAALDILGLQLVDLASLNARPRRIRLLAELTEPDISFAGQRIYARRPAGASLLIGPAMRALVQQIPPPALALTATVDFDRRSATVGIEKTGQIGRAHV